MKDREVLKEKDRRNLLGDIEMYKGKRKTKKE
jgi:hypothetical protein